MGRPLLLSLSSAGRPFAVRCIGVGGVRRGVPEAAWIYQPGFPAENGSAFMTNERRFSPQPGLCTGGWLLNVAEHPGWHPEPKGVLADR